MTSCPICGSPLLLVDHGRVATISAWCRGCDVRVFRVVFTGQEFWYRSGRLVRRRIV